MGKHERKPAPPAAGGADRSYYRCNNMQTGRKSRPAAFKTEPFNQVSTMSPASTRFDPHPRQPPLGADASDADANDPGPPRTLGCGQAYLYIVGCRDDSVFKIGFSRDPLQRWRCLHPRFFEFFDLDHGLVVRTDRVAQARRMESELHAAFRFHEAPAPTIVPPGAAGHTEWFRGVIDEAVAAARALALQHAFVHEAPASWFSALLCERKERLFDWSARMLEAIEYAEHNQGGIGADLYARELRAALDAYWSVGIDPRPLLPDSVIRWYAPLMEGAPSGATPDSGPPAHYR